MIHISILPAGMENANGLARSRRARQSKRRRPGLTYFGVASFVHHTHHPEHNHLIMFSDLQCLWIVHATVIYRESAFQI